MSTLCRHADASKLFAWRRFHAYPKYRTANFDTVPCFIFCWFLSLFLFESLLIQPHQAQVLGVAGVGSSAEDHTLAKMLTQSLRKALVCVLHMGSNSFPDIYRYACFSLCFPQSVRYIPAVPLDFGSECCISVVPVL